MSPTELLVVALAGAGGAVLRHELTAGRPLLALHAVNVVGSLVLGIALGAAVGGVAALGAAAGLGGLTSFSSWVAGVRDVERDDDPGVRRGPLVVTVGHLLAPAVLAVTAAALGAAIGSAWVGPGVVG